MSLSSGWAGGRESFLSPPQAAQSGAVQGHVGHPVPALTSLLAPAASSLWLFLTLRMTRELWRERRSRALAGGGCAAGAAGPNRAEALCWCVSHLDNSSLCRHPLINPDVARGTTSYPRGLRFPQNKMLPMQMESGAAGEWGAPCTPRSVWVAVLPPRGAQTPGGGGRWSRDADVTLRAGKFSTYQHEQECYLLSEGEA